MFRRLGPPAASLAALALCCACARAAAPARIVQNAFAAGAVGDLVRQPSPGAEGCHLDGNYVTLDHEDADAPAVVLIENHVGADWGGRFVAWADGAALFDPVVDASTDTRTTALAPARVERLRAAVAAQLAGHEPYLRTTGLAHAPETTLIVRDGAGWRVARVFGAGREDVLAPPAPAPRSSWFDPPPAWFAAAFRLALRAFPKHGRTYVPYAYRLELLTDPPRPPGEPGFRQDYGAPMAWPGEFPAPPPSQDPRQCDLTTQATEMEAVPCRYRVDHERAPAARRLIAAMHDDRGRLRPVVHASQPWLLRFDARYPGQDTISHITRCIEDHASPARAPGWASP